MNEKQWRWSLLNWIVLWMLLAAALYLSGVRLAQAQADETEAAGQPPYHELRLYLRYSDGTAVTGEPITLERLPQELPMPCVTDERGRCTWQVGRGLYQVLFERPLDQISALSLAEGGLRGFGLTVGEFDIAYHFVFYHDGRAYFDAAPDALRPKPVLPQFQSIQGGTLPDLPDTWAIQYTETVTTTQAAVTVNGRAEATAAVTQANTFTTGSGSTVLLLVGLGLLLGGGLHLLQRRWGATAPGTKTAVPPDGPSSIVDGPSSPAEESHA